MQSLKNSAIAALLLLGLSGNAYPASVAERSSDLWINAKIVTLFTVSEHLNPFDLDADVEDGVATLSGKVDSDIEKDLAEELTIGVEGVNSVVNNIEITPEAPKRGALSGLGDTFKNSATTTKIKSQFMWNSNIPSNSVHVSTRGHEVELSGQVDSKEQRDLAEEIARNTAGVEYVKNEIEIVEGTKTVGESAEETFDSLSRSAKDTWITTKIKSSFLYDKSVPGTGVNVDTVEGVVTLTGTVADEAAKSRAESIAAGIKGVEKVVSNITVGG